MLHYKHDRIRARPPAYAGAFLCLALGLAASVPAGATEASDVSPAALTAPARADKPAALPARAEKAQFLGRAPYLCTPSGFGRMGSCYLRTSYTAAAR